MRSIGLFTYQVPFCTTIYRKAPGTGNEQCPQTEFAVVRFSRQQRKRGPLAGLDGALALRLDAFFFASLAAGATLSPGSSRYCEQRSGEKLTCGICSDSVG